MAAPARPIAPLADAPPEDPAPPPRRPRRALAPLLLILLVVCALTQDSTGPLRDEPDLLPAAERLLDGRLVPAEPGTDPRAYLWHGPGLVALIAPMVALDLPLTAMRFLMPLLLFGAALAFHRLLRIRLGPRPALLWTYVFGLYVPFWAVLHELHKEPPSILLVVAAMLATARGLESGSRLALAGAGLALAALTMIRLEYGWVALALLALALAGWAVRRHSATARRLVLVAAVAVAGCLPWLAYTHHLTGKPLYWGSSSGLSIFWMSPTLSGENGHWYEPETVERDPALAPLRPLFRRVEGLDPVASDLALREQAVANVRARPLAFARNVAANTTRLLFAWPMRPQLSVTRIGGNVLFNGLLLAGVAWSLVWVARRQPRLPPEALPIAVFAALGIGVHLPASASPRMLLPIVPPLLWIVAQAVAARGRAGAGQAPAARAARTS